MCDVVYPLSTRCSKHIHAGDMEIFKPPNIFYLKGVFLSDIHKTFEQLLEDKFSETDDKLDVLHTSTPSISEMPKIFTDVASWPRDTNLRCATCFGNCGASLVFVPRCLDKNRQTGEYEWGVIPVPFDSFACAAYHIQWFMKNDSQYKLLLARLHETFTNERVVEVIPALAPWRMHEMGGDLSHADYLRINAHNNSVFNNFSITEIPHTKIVEHETYDAVDTDDQYDDDTENFVL